jgi:hypothetical protein
VKGFTVFLTFVYLLFLYRTREVNSLWKVHLQAERDNFSSENSAAHLEYGVESPVLSSLNLISRLQSVNQASSQLYEKRPRCSYRGFFNMAAAAILQNGVGSTVLSFLDSVGFH